MKSETNILPVDPLKIGKFIPSGSQKASIEDWRLEPNVESPDYKSLAYAALALRDSNVPVAFPTETVYGLGADATRSDAVRGIYAAKQRPLDNPLIVHFASLNQLRSLLRPSSNGAELHQESEDAIPSIYKPLIGRFWPGPLTIILPLPQPSPLAPEISAGLKTFGARIPRNALALALIQLADRPIAAPSANASTKPSPTAAEHVKDDLDGRIHTIIDGGPCDVGVESTVVDGLSDPPAILRPGGVSLEQLRECPGWEKCVVGYKDQAEGDITNGRASGEGPRAPGMKYRHYSPKAPVVLHEVGSPLPSIEQLCGPKSRSQRRVGIIRTGTWPSGLGHKIHLHLKHIADDSPTNGFTSSHDTTSSTKTNGHGNGHVKGPIPFLPTLDIHPPPEPSQQMLEVQSEPQRLVLAWDVWLGNDLETIARGLFSALRSLDRLDVDAIFVEGIDESRGDGAAAIMNRLRKAAEENVSPQG